MSATVSSSFIAMRPKVSRMSLADGERIRVAVRPLRVHVDEAHLHGAERTGELPVAAVALVAEPRVLGAPEDLVGLPDVLAPEAEAERLEPHRLVARSCRRRSSRSAQEILRPYFCLTGQSNRRALSRFALSGQLLSGAKRCCAAAATAAAVGDAVRAGGVPASSG